MLGVWLETLVHVLSWPTIGLVVIGVIVGSVIAFLPGIGSITGLVILLPFALSLSSDNSLVGLTLLLSAYAVMCTADSTLAILFGIPGSSGAQALIMDGYPMARKGQAGKALGASFLSSGLGGLIGAFAFFLAIPVVPPLVRTFGSPELLVLALWGVSMVGLLSGRTPLRGLAMGALGLLLGTVGLDPQRGLPRFTLGFGYLWDGLPIVPIALGLFAIPQAIELIRSKTLLNVDLGAQQLRIGYRDVFEGMRATLSHWALVLRSSFMGVFLGIIPGVGGSVIDWLVYGQTVHSARDRKDFGRGDIRGVIGPDSATNSKEGGQLIPTLAFGVPGGAGMALFLSAFLALGITPGTDMLTTRVDVTFTLVWIIAVANVFCTAGLLLITPQLARVTLFRAPLLATVIFTFSILGAYMANRELGDLLVLAIFGVLGHAMKEAGWPRPPLLLGFVLSTILERYLFISINTFGWSWLWRSGVLILYAVILGSYGVLLASRLGRGGRRASAVRRDGTAARE